MSYRTPLPTNAVQTVYQQLASWPDGRGGSWLPLVGLPNKIATKYLKSNRDGPSHVGYSGFHKHVPFDSMVDERKLRGLRPEKRTAEP